MTSMVAPEARGKAYRRVLVVAEIQDLGMMQAAENGVKQLADSLARNPPVVVCDPECRAPGALAPGSAFIAAHTILFPGREYSPDALRAILDSNRIEATLVLSPTASGVDVSYVPPTYMTNCSTWRTGTSCSTSSIGGMSLESPWVSFSARLYDARTGETAWIATATTNGSALSGVPTLIRSMTRKTLMNLISDQVVR
jgi:hypothetical protein